MRFIVEEIAEVSMNVCVGDITPTTKRFLAELESKGIFFERPTSTHSPKGSCRTLLLSYIPHIAEIRSQCEKWNPESVYLLTDNSALADRVHQFCKTKKILLKTCVVDRDSTKDVEQIALSLLTSEKNLHDHSDSSKGNSIDQDLPKTSSPRKRQLAKLGAVFLLLLFTFIIPYGVSGIYLYKTARSLRTGSVSEAHESIKSARPFVETSQSLYHASRPVLSFFFLAFVFDPLLDIQKTSYSLLQNAVVLGEQLQTLSEELQAPGSTKNLDSLASSIAQQSLSIHASTQTLLQLIPPLTLTKDIRSQLEDAGVFLEKFNPILTNLPEMIGGDAPHTYLVYFYNNMELRPGGGFIGSFAFVTFQRYKLIDFTVHDVYDADGQLKAHIDPPEAIRSHLGQPHWFLRDSNTDPDFERNISQGLFFLEKELPQLPTFDGVVGITTTGVGTLLEAFDSIYVSDYDETITSSNFYLKTQLEAEKEFFPGSIGKKSFLSSLTHSILNQADKASPITLAHNLKKSLDEKHVVLFFQNPLVQKRVEEAGWNGKIIDTPCLSGTSSCISDYFMPVDMNVGLNKANYYLSRFISIQPTIKSSGDVDTKITVTYRNDSPTELYPAGTYKTFSQFYIPRQAVDFHVRDQSGRELLFNNSIASGRRVLGTYFEVPPLSQYTVTIQYSLPRKPLSEKIGYQLVIQKQIGSINNDLNLNIDYPTDYSLVSKNFQTLAKAHSVNYNTNLLADRVFVIEFQRKN